MNDEITERKLRRLFPNAAESFIKSNSDSRKSSKLEQGTKNEPLVADKVKERDTGAGFILITDFRKRLLDDDNLCEKFHVDALRYSGYIKNDSRKQYKIFTTQEKLSKEIEPYTLIEIHD